MLHHMEPSRPVVADSRLFNDRIEQLVEAANRNEPLAPVMLRIVQSLGYDSFMYGMCMNVNRPQQDHRTYVWTTLPREWVALYDRKSYIEIDPRLTRTWNRTSPMLWDSATMKDDWSVQDFLADAATFGIRSGIVFSFRDNDHARIIVALNSSAMGLTDEQFAARCATKGDVMLLATCFHDLFMAQFVDQGARPNQHGVALSPRELECLALAARGMTSADIGFKLGITERTANFHFSNIISKLGVINRHEAIAHGVARGLVGPNTS